MPLPAKMLGRRFRPTNPKGCAKKEEGQAYFEASELHKQCLKIDTPLFEKLAKKMHTSAGTAKRRYYGRKDTFDQIQNIIDELGLGPEEIRKWGDVIYLCQYLIDAMEEVETSQRWAED